MMFVFMQIRSFAITSHKIKKILYVYVPVVLFVVVFVVFFFAFFSLEERYFLFLTEVSVVKPRQ